MGTSFPYNESLLHWLWKNRYLKNRKLFTGSGEKVHIHHPGYSNSTDGPDFTNARITIGTLMWHGDVEIHWTAKDWFNHKHHTDNNFTRVILHLVYDDSKPAEVHRQDGSKIPTLHLKPLLSEPLQHFFHQFQQADTLPCAGHLSSVPVQILHEQFEQAHNEYFEQKVDDFLQFYDPKLTLSQAWQHALIIALFDNLGISHNRKPMRKLAGMMIAEYHSESSPQALTKQAFRRAGVEPKNPNASFSWNHKGSRPANHPKIRIRQACKMLWFIKKNPFQWWLRTGIEKSFDTLLQSVNTEPAIGSHQSDVLFGTVWLPGFYLLGDLTGTKRLKLTARNKWLKHRTRLPHSITKHFSQARMPPSVFEKKLGSVHQFRTYCRPRRCEHCKVFKNAISS